MTFSLTVINRQRKVPFRTSLILRIAECARAGCRAAARSPDVPLLGLDRVEVTILSDRQIGRVHADFFNDPSPTDVITFDHGEILLGAGQIRENARQYRHTPDEEAALCVVHGMLHLAGWGDQTRAEAKQMAAAQEQIFKKARGML